MGAGSTKNVHDAQRRAQAEADGMPLDKAGSPKYVSWCGRTFTFVVRVCVRGVRACVRHTSARACVRVRVLPCTNS